MKNNENTININNTMSIIPLIYYVNSDIKKKRYLER